MYMVRQETAEVGRRTLTRLQEWEAALSGILRGKEEIVRLSLVSLLARGHLLIEDVPGVGKTTLAQALARSVNCEFQRLQFTSDMLPGDVLGVSIYNAREQEFEFKPGPVFTNFLVADEINRATPKTQSALLEAMNEDQVTVDGRRHLLPQPFMVVATQNPVEHHGTYPLPESQLDRFLMRVRIGYPDLAAERLILRNQSQHGGEAAPPLLTAEEVLAIQAKVQSVTMDESVLNYLLAIVARTRQHDALSLGVSPRGAQALYRAAQAMALMDGREFAIPDDVKRLIIPVCAHRVIVNSRHGLQSPRSSGQAEQILQDLLTLIDVPL